MGPAQAEVLGLDEVRASFFAGLVVGIAEGQRAVELVIDFIAGVDVYRPGAQREIGAGEGQVEIVSQHEVHAGVADIETAGLFLAEGGHQQTRGALRLLGYEAEGEYQGHRNAGHYGPGRAEDRLLRRLGDDLGHGQLQVVVRLLQVTDRVNALGEVDGLVRHHLDVLALQQAFALLGDHVGDAGLLGVEVVAEFVHFIRLAVFGHFGQAFPFSGGGVLAAAREDGVGLHVVLNVVCREFHVLVAHRGAAVVVDLALTVGEIRDDGVLGGGEGRFFQGTLAQQVQGVFTGRRHRVGDGEGIR